MEKAAATTKCHQPRGRGFSWESDRLSWDEPLLFFFVFAFLSISAQLKLYCGFSCIVPHLSWNGRWDRGVVVFAFRGEG